MEFGLILSAEAVLAAASAGGNYKVTMTWKGAARIALKGLSGEHGKQRLRKL